MSSRFCPFPAESVEGGSKVSCTKNRKIPPQEGVHLFAVAVVVHLFRMEQVTEGCVTEMVRVKSADSPLSATAGVKTPPQGTGVCILACQVRLSCFCRFPAQLKVGVECLARGTEKFLSRKVCAFLVWLQLCMFVCIQKGTEESV